MLSIKAETLAGSSIEATAAEMVALATKLDVIVTLKFNDVTLFAHPKGDASEIIRRYYREIRRGVPYWTYA